MVSDSSKCWSVLYTLLISTVVDLRSFEVEQRSFIYPFNFCCCRSNSKVNVVSAAACARLMKSIRKCLLSAGSWPSSTSSSTWRRVSAVWPDHDKYLCSRGLLWPRLLRLFWVCLNPQNLKSSTHFPLGFSGKAGIPKRPQNKLTKRCGQSTMKP